MKLNFLLDITYKMLIGRTRGVAVVDLAFGKKCVCVGGGGGRLYKLFKLMDFWESFV